MGNAAARMGDMAKQDAPHCHAPIHPAAPVPTPVPHPAVPVSIVKGEATVLIENKPAARVGDTTSPCSMPCGAAPGTIAMGSGTVMIGNMPAARVNDMTAHSGCVAPIPSPTGKILSPGAPTVMIGG